MKAIRVHEFGSSDVLRVDDIPGLDVGDGQVLIRVHAAGVNPVDTYIRSGTYAVKPECPFTPGFDGAGEVAALGAGVEAFATGQRVYFSGTASGAYAELALCDSTQVYPLPENVSFEEGASVGVPYGTAYVALFSRAHAAPGETVLIHGATGGVGTAAVQMARAHGMTVMGTGGSDRGRSLLAEQGAHHVLDHHNADYLDEVMALTYGSGVDVIIEMLANVNLGKDLTMLARGGRVVVVGSRGTVEVNPRDAMGREGAILGMVLLNQTPTALARVHAGIRAGLENESLEPVVGRTFGLDNASQAQDAVMEPGAYGNIVIATQ